MAKTTNLLYTKLTEGRGLEWTIMTHENRKPMTMISAPAEGGKEDSEE
jgi:hypothetical protein